MYDALFRVRGINIEDRMIFAVMHHYLKRFNAVNFSRIFMN